MYYIFAEKSTHKIALYLHTVYCKNYELYKLTSTNVRVRVSPKRIEQYKNIEKLKQVRKVPVSVDSANFNEIKFKNRFVRPWFPRNLLERLHKVVYRFLKKKEIETLNRSFVSSLYTSGKMK